MCGRADEPGRHTQGSRGCSWGVFLGPTWHCVIKSSNPRWLRCARDCTGTMGIVVTKRWPDQYCADGARAVSDHYGLTLENCAVAVLTDPLCTGRYFYYSKELCKTSSCNYRQCKCATKQCARQSAGDAFDIYEITGSRFLARRCFARCVFSYSLTIARWCDHEKTEGMS